MSRWLPAIALGCLLAALAVGAIQALGQQAPTGTERSDALARELRCPDCQGLSVADSPTQSAQEIRRQIEELVAGGATDDDVRSYFVARYGEWILLAPSSPLYWLLPVGVVLLAAAALVAWMLGGPRRPVAVDPASADERRRVREEAEALDA